LSSAIVDATAVAVAVAAFASAAAAAAVNAAKIKGKIRKTLRTVSNRQPPAQ